ncbi:MarR family winged helix-turn-helix transcriptional regulator [Megasphaera massiliensis]|uniref:MarR family winged helix-turn-helix transcriptional regulator n=1 Tax=Megasphaera massiliensis TaxID=1232428 RepID=UPI00040547EA|nr:MarR family transcriptional regulator [Megasphaera massiliensis]MBS6256251.1 MarR family transcriptional regulator [Megasphaera sp.]
MNDIYKQTKDYSRIRDNLLSIFENYARKRGLQSKSMLILMWIYYHPEGIPQHEIAQKTYSTKQVVNATIKSFKEKGYLRFEENSRDKRMKLITLTEEGRTYAASVLDLLEEAEMLAMSELTPDERDFLLRISRKFNDALARNIGDYHD